MSVEREDEQREERAEHEEGGAEGEQRAAGAPVPPGGALRDEREGGSSEHGTRWGPKVRSGSGALRENGYSRSTQLHHTRHTLCGPPLGIVSAQDN